MGKELVASLQPELKMMKDPMNAGFVVDLLLEGSDLFLTWASSSTGKYHPQDEINESGMLLHVKRCAAIAPDIARMYALPEGPLMSLGDDVLIAGSLVHDLYKRGKDNDAEHTQRDHMLIIYEKIRDKQLDIGLVDNTFVDMLANACLHHEGRWTPGPAYRLEGYQSIYAQALHTIDMITSRRRIWEIMRDEWVTDAIG